MSRRNDHCGLLQRVPYPLRGDPRARQPDADTSLPPAALAPVVAGMGVQVSTLVTGALFVETVFSYPGIGTLLFRALQTRDYPLIQGILLVTAVVVLLANFTADRLGDRIDPRGAQHV